MARVLLIQAAVHATHVERAQPLGLMSLGAFLRAARGDDVRICDMRLAWRDFGAPLRMFAEFRPDVVGIGAHGVDAPAMHRLAIAVKSVSPLTPVICGGPYSALYWEEAVKNAAIDGVAIGEGEHTFREWLDARDGGGAAAPPPGLAFLRDGRAARSAVRAFEADLDRFPFPAYDLIDLGAYSRLPRIGLIYRHPRYATVETARGCPFHCAWCHRSMGDRWRPHSAAYVIALFEKLVREHGVRDLVIIDDLVNLDPVRFETILQGAIDRRLEAGIAVCNGFRADLATDASLDLMARAGVYRVMIAIETASPRLQKTMAKNLDLERTREVIRRLSARGISVHGNLIVGFPTESAEEMRQTVRYAARSQLDTFGLYRATPFRGSRLFEMAVAAGATTPADQGYLSFWESAVNLSTTPSSWLNRFSRLAVPYFYLRPRRLVGLLRRLPHPWRQLPFLLRFFFRKTLFG
jgi:radical SAM superfamily enzyme YgiQ (UPF0313 family)